MSSFKNTGRELVGMRVRKLRLERGMTLQQLANLINADRQYVWNIENGDVNLTVDYIDRIAGALQVEQRDFFNTD